MGSTGGNIGTGEDIGSAIAISVVPALATVIGIDMDGAGGSPWMDEMSHVLKEKHLEDIRDTASPDFAPQHRQICSSA